MNLSKSASTATGSVPACCRSCKVCLEISRSSKERYCRLPADPHIAGAQPVAQFRQHAEFVVAPVDDAARHDVGAQRCRTNPVGADLGRVDASVRFISRSTSMARMSEADAGTLSNANAARKRATSAGCRRSARRGSG